MSAGDGFAGLDIASGLIAGLLDRSALRAEARVHEENARLALLEGEELVARTMREERQVSGRAIAAIAGSGVQVGSGTAADIIRQNAIEREVEIGNLRTRAQGAARNSRQRAVDARFAGDSALIGSFVEAGARVVSYAAQRDARDRVQKQAESERAARLEALTVDRSDPGAAGSGALSVRPRRRFGVLSTPGAR